MQHPSPLVEAKQLQSWLQQDTSPVVLDVGFDLQAPQAGYDAYLAEHILGAHYVHLERDLCGAKTGHNGRHPLPERATFARLVAAWGVAPNQPVVVYDRQNAMFAARLWWMLRWLGHAEVYVLNGGWHAWQQLKGPTATGPSATKPFTALALDPYPHRSALERVTLVQTIEQNLNQLPILDARAPERYRGEIEPLDTRAGHIPGAQNRFFQLNLAGYYFQSAAELAAQFKTLLKGRDAQNIIHQCGSGVSACHNILAMHIAGLPGSSLYVDSWSGWCSDPARPIACGNET